ncbi:hypothetical protein R50073_01400 [Maricurvus nonylphenolicus]|uniref:universal stress protein n=1 Tax=Maricurvus nonylphenolicus TaxID=1008307 RepID=UPI0036F2E461
MNTPKTRETVIVLVDPCHYHQPALDNFVQMVKSAEDNSDIEVLVAISPTSKESENLDLISCSNTWLEDKVHTPLKELHIPYSLQFIWTYNWDEAVLKVSKQNDAILTIVPYYSDLPGTFFNDDKWKLLRKASNPILISSDQDYSKANTILCTLKTQDNKYAERNQRVVEAAESLSSLFGLDTHAVNAYNDSMEYPDRAQIASQTGIDNDKIHVKIGDPQDVICKVAEDIDANLVLIASQQRSGLHGALRGNMIEKIVERMDRSILMI